MDDKELDERLRQLAKEEEEDFSPEFYETEMDRVIARKKELEEEKKELEEKKKELEEGTLTDEKLDEMLRELAKEEEEDFSPEFYATEMDRVIARKKEIEEEEKKGPRL